jgi:hypothetical protein
MSTTDLNNTDLNADFARGIRAELSSIGTSRSRLRRNQRRTRAIAIGAGALTLAGATTGAAAVVNNLPGTTTVGPLGSIVSASHTGTGTIDLGKAPANAAVVIVNLTCVSPRGTLTLKLDPNGSESAESVQTDCGVASGTTHITDGLLPAAGSTSITVNASSGTTWRATAQYATSSTSPWKVNANGQTYGVANGRGVPDLSAAETTTGKQGYIFTKQVLAMDHDGFINVYESDGTTVIGKFPIGGGTVGSGK